LGFRIDDNPRCTSARSVGRVRTLDQLPEAHGVLSMTILEPAAIGHFAQRVCIGSLRLTAIAGAAEGVFEKVVLVVELVFGDLGYPDFIVAISDDGIIGVKFLPQQ